MTTIIRVKRHRNEDPHEALILSCKKKKVEDNLPISDGESFEKILNFSGTIEEKDDKIAASTVESFVKSSKYSELKNKEHVPDIKSKQRKIWKERSDENRFTLLSCLRSTNGFESPDIPGDVSEKSGKDITIVDVSNEHTEKASQNKTDNSYVYDLYSAYFDSDRDYKEFSDLYKDNLVSVQPWNYEWDYEYRNPEEDDDEMDPDEDDSNDENNWRNDYPDSDPDNTRSMNDDDDDDADGLVHLVKDIKIVDGDFELSSDSGEENHLNYSDNENYSYYEAEDMAGKKYAKFKARAMKQFMGKGGGDDDDDEEEKEKDDGSSVEDEDDDDDFSDCIDFPCDDE